MSKTILNRLNDSNNGVSTLCARFKVTRGTIYQSISGYGSRKIRVEIALILGEKPSVLWSNNNVESIELDDSIFAARCINRKIAQKQLAKVMS